MHPIWHAGLVAAPINGTLYRPELSYPIQQQRRASAA